MSKYQKLKTELDEQINTFDKESIKHKKMYRRFRYMVFILTASSTALASVSLTIPKLQEPANMSIVFITVIVAVITSIEGLRKPAELWVHERTTYHNLTDIKRELEYNAADEIDTASVDVLFQRMQSVIAGSGEKWKKKIVSVPTQTPTGSAGSRPAGGAESQPDPSGT